MILRPELMPPRLDEALVDALIDDLAIACDPLVPLKDATQASARLNARAGTALLDVHWVRGNEDYDVFVRHLLCGEKIRPAPNVTRDELVEVVRRAFPQVNDDEADRRAYMDDLRCQRDRSECLEHDLPSPRQLGQAPSTPTTRRRSRSSIGFSLGRLRPLAPEDTSIAPPDRSPVRLMTLVRVFPRRAPWVTHHVADPRWSVVEWEVRRLDDDRRPMLASSCRQRMRSKTRIRFT